MGASSTSTGTTPFAVATITSGLVNATTAATPRCIHLSWRRRGANICHQRLEHPNERIADYYRNYCETTAVIQQFSSHNAPKHTGLSEQDGRTIVDMAQCMLNGAALPMSLRGGIAANMVFLLNRPPSKTIGGDTSYNRMFAKHVSLFFL